MSVKMDFYTFMCAKKVELFQKYLQQQNIRILEVGVGTGVMTAQIYEIIKDTTNQLDVVDIDQNSLASMPSYIKATKYVTPIETFKSPHLYDLIILSDVLEHVKSPWAVLENCKKLMIEGAHLIIFTPNGYSVNRLLGVKMHILGHGTDLGEHDKAAGHLRIFNKLTLRSTIDYVFDVPTMWQITTHLFKPLTTAQMDGLNSIGYLEACWELSMKFPDNGAFLFADVVNTK